MGWSVQAGGLSMHMHASYMNPCYAVRALCVRPHTHASQKTTTLPFHTHMPDGEQAYELDTPDT